MVVPAGLTGQRLESHTYLTRLACLMYVWPQASYLPSLSSYTLSWGGGCNSEVELLFSVLIKL